MQLRSPNPTGKGFGIEAAKAWAEKEIKEGMEFHEIRLIRCARLAVAEHERAENWEGYATALAKDRTKKAERDDCTEENLTARFYSAQQPTRAKGYWWCPRCEQQIDPGLHDCGSECSWIEREEPEPPAETPAPAEVPPDMRHFTGACHDCGHTGRLAEWPWEKDGVVRCPACGGVAIEVKPPAPDPLAVDLRAAGRVYRRALVAIREVERIQEAISKGYPRPADSAADIARRLRLFARAVATDLGDDFELVERKSAELEIEHREQADVWERESTAAMLERLLPGEAGAILSCLVRGCFQHWSPEDGIPEDLSFTDD